MVCKLLQDAPRQHAGSGNSVHWGRRTSLRERNAEARSTIRSSDWAHLRQVRGRSPTGGIDAAQSLARRARDPHGPWMALAREDMAPPLLRPRKAHTQLPTDNAVAARTRGAAPTVRSQSRAPPAAIAALPGRGCPAGSVIDGEEPCSQVRVQSSGAPRRPPAAGSGAGPPLFAGVAGLAVRDQGC